MCAENASGELRQRSSSDGVAKGKSSCNSTLGMGSDTSDEKILVVSLVRSEGLVMTD